MNLETAVKRCPGTRKGISGAAFQPMMSASEQYFFGERTKSRNSLRFAQLSSHLVINYGF